MLHPHGHWVEWIRTEDEIAFPSRRCPSLTIPTPTQLPMQPHAARSQAAAATWMCEKQRSVLPSSGKAHFTAYSTLPWWIPLLPQGKQDLRLHLRSLWKIHLIVGFLQIDKTKLNKTSIYYLNDLFYDQNSLTFNYEFSNLLRWSKSSSLGSH